jgi:hypothetical protein
VIEEKIFSALLWLNKRKKIREKYQDCGSGSQLDLDAIGSVDPDPASESGSGSRRAKMTHKSRENLKISCVEV